MCRRTLTPLLLLAGVGLVLLATREPADVPLTWTIIALSVAALLTFFSPTNRTASNILDRIRHPSNRSAWFAAIAIGCASSAFFVGSASFYGRDLMPKWHDEYSYLLQMQMLAHGRLWMPQHPLADFFESFHIFVKPVYASLYFPGTALMYVPSIWLGLPSWFMPVLVSGSVVGLLYRIVTQLIDGVHGLLAAVLLVSLPTFRLLALMVMSQPVLLFTELAAFWCWLRWRENKNWHWALLIGVFSGWAVITRPVDAMCYAIPLGLAVLLDLRVCRIPKIARTVLLIAIGAAPLLSLQIILNIGITGSPWELPHHYYTKLDMPQMTFGFQKFDPTLRPASKLPQKQMYYDEWMVPIIKDHRVDTLIPKWAKEKLPLTLRATLPSPALALSLPIGVLGLTDRRRIVLWTTLPLFVVLYAFFPYLLRHYAIMAAPAVILSVLVGAHWLQRAYPRILSAGLPLAIAALALASIPEWQPPGEDRLYLPLRDIEDQLASKVRPPAVVLFRFHSRYGFHAEPVYNSTVAWPDDAPIIRAHDLGPQRNMEIFRYYAERQPQRMFYLFDRDDHSLHPLGTAAELGGPAAH
jgi:uncharacterized membrane protein YfcA